MDSEGRITRVLCFVLAMGMAVGGLVALSAPVLADYHANVDLALAYDNGWQEPSAMPDTDVQLIYNYDVTHAHPYWLGDTNDNMNVGIVNRDGTNAVDNVRVTLASGDSALTNIEAQDADYGTEYDLGGIAAGGSGTATFQFDVSPTAALGLHAITLTINYEKPSGTPQPAVNAPARIYLSSVFDDPSTRDNHESLADLDETTATETTDFGRFEAGDTFVEGGIALHNYATVIDDFQAVLTPPSDGDPDYISVVGDNFDALIPGGIPAGGADSPLWRFNILPGTPPDEYTAQVHITFERNGQNIDEGTRDVFMEVDYCFRNIYPTPNNQPYSEYQCRATSVTITDTGEGNATRHGRFGTVAAETPGDETESIVIEPLAGAREADAGPSLLIPVGLAMMAIVLVTAFFIRKRE